jgi:hypothetical protein
MKLWVRLLLGITLLAGVLAIAQPVLAAGETYTWSGYDEIVADGGDLTERVVFKRVANPGIIPDTVEMVLNGALIVKVGSEQCTFPASLYVHKDGTVQFWRPKPYPDTVGQTGGIPNCSKLHPDVIASYHGDWLTVGGDRGANPTRPETDAEKSVRIDLHPSQPFSTAPPSTAITIKRNGAVVVQLTVPVQEDVGAVKYPPDQTPAFYLGQTTLEAPEEKVEYEICDTVVIPTCQKFIKERYKPLTLTYGTRFERPHEKQIEVHVVTPFKRPCGSSFTANPILVEITGPNGQKQSKETEVVRSEPNANEAGQICDVDGEVTSTVTFENVDPGTWKACVAGNQCKDVQKELGEKAEVTIRSEPEVVMAENQPVCTTGSGLAGALAWILCPLTALIAGATAFIEQNIILPYLTVSPLTTNADNPVYIAWQGLRNIANVFFVVVFLMAILSIGFSRYGVKRTLPRVAIVAIGINLSYFVVAFIIDVFNIFGAGVGQLVMSVLQQGGAGAQNVDPSAGQFWALGGAAVLALIVKAGPVIGWLFGMFAAAFLIILATVLVLIIRQMLILFLVMISPLAILLWLLPGTEDYFTKWRQLLFQLLMMYPLIVLLFASGKILGALLGTPNYTLVGEDTAASADVAEVIRVIFQFLAQTFPLVLLPFTFKLSGRGIARMSDAIHGFTQRGARRATKGIKNSKAGQFVGAKLANRRTRLASSPPNTRGINAINPLAWKRRAGRAVRSNYAFNKATGGLGSYLDRDNARARRDMENQVKQNLRGDLPAAFALADAGGNRRKLASIIKNGRTSDGTMLDLSSRQNLQQMLNDNTYKGALVASAVGETLANTSQITAGSYENLTNMANADGAEARDEFIAEQNKANDKNGFSNLGQAAWGQRADGTVGFKQFAPEFGLKSASQVYSGLRLRDTSKYVLNDQAMVQQIQAHATTTQGRAGIMREAAHMASDDQRAHLAGAMHGWVMRTKADGTQERDIQATLGQQAFQDDLQTARDEIARGR